MYNTYSEYHEVHSFGIEKLDRLQATVFDFSAVSLAFFPNVFVLLYGRERG